MLSRIVSTTVCRLGKTIEVEAYFQKRRGANDVNLLTTNSGCQKFLSALSFFILENAHLIDIICGELHYVNEK